MSAPVRHDVDVAIIGAGTAGMAAYRRVKDARASVRLISDDFGTTCAKVGCMPSKTLLAAAKARHAARSLGDFGIGSASPRIDGAAVMHRVRALRDRFTGHVIDSIDGWPDEDVIDGRARFVDAHTLAVGDAAEVRAERILIATGSSPSIPPELRSAGNLLHTTDTLFEWPELPRRVVVFGAGAIGLEIGQALAMLDCAVTLCGHNGSIGGLSDPEVVAQCQAMAARQMDYFPHQEIQSIRTSDEQGSVTIDARGDMREIEFDAVIAAAGRTPNVAGLDLERTGMELGEDGMPEVDFATGATGLDHIYLAGDVNERRPLLHEAAFEGRNFSENLVHRQPLAKRPKTALRLVFTEPGLAVVGATHGELKERGIDFVAGEVDFSDQGRATVDNRAFGRLHVYGERSTGRLLGAEMIAPDAEHLAHLLAWAIESRQGIPDLVDFPFYHPTVEEGMRSALRDAASKIRVEGDVPARSIDRGPGC